MVSKKNIMEIVRKLMDHVDQAEGAFYRDELLARIISICSHKNYQYITNFEWYISVLVELTKVEGSKHGVLIAEQVGFFNCNYYFLLEVISHHYFV